MSSPSSVERQAVHNAGWLIALRALQVAGGLLFAAVVPRLMGPYGYGQVALLVSFSVLANMLANFGFTEVLGREVPRFIQAGDQLGLTALFGRLMAVRVSASVLTAAMYLGVASVWLRDLDWLAPALLSVAIVVRAPGTLCFSLQLGLNRAARWGVAEITRQWGNMLLMLPGYLLGGLRGAALGVLLLEVVVTVIGAVGVRSYLRWSTLRMELKTMSPFLRIGIFFYAGDLISAAFERSGELLLRSLLGDYAQIGFFRVAYSAYVTGASAIPRIALAFAPLLTTLLLAGDHVALRIWYERLGKWLVVGSMMALLGTFVAGKGMVPLVLGRVYEPVTPSLIALMAGLLALSVTSVANLAALTHGRTSIVMFASAARLITFWLLGPALVGRFGSLGACLAVVGALFVQALLTSLVVQRRAHYSLRGSLGAVLLGALFLPLGLLRGSLPASIGLLLLALAGYGLLLYLFRLITPAELSAIRGVLRRARARQVMPRQTPITASEDGPCGCP
jgi:O-antigen/teichoic acid export membrane protein